MKRKLEEDQQSLRLTSFTSLELKKKQKSKPPVDQRESSGWKSMGTRIMKYRLAPALLTGSPQKKLDVEKSSKFVSHIFFFKELVHLKFQAASVDFFPCKYHQHC